MLYWPFLLSFLCVLLYILERRSCVVSVFRGNYHSCLDWAGNINSACTLLGLFTRELPLYLNSFVTKVTTVDFNSGSNPLYLGVAKRNSGAAPCSIQLQSRRFAHSGYSQWAIAGHCIFAMPTRSLWRLLCCMFASCCLHVCRNRRFMSS